MAEELAEGLYWHPLNLPHYKTFRNLSGFSEVSLTVPAWLVEGAANLIAVYSADEDADVGDWLPLGASVSVASEGFKQSGWGTLASGAMAPVYVALALDVTTAMAELSLGQAELRAK